MHRSRRDRSGSLLALRATLVLAAAALAYHYSLLSLLRNLASDTPLAYLGLVPFIALLLVVVTMRRWRWEPDVHDRHVDYILGIPLLLFALSVVVIGPAVLSSFYWRWRLDLLTLPVFVAGAVVVVFGLRTGLRLKTAIGFLFLAWPLPYTLLLNDWLQAFTDATIRGLRQIVELAPVALAVGGTDGSIFFIPHGNAGFLVSVGSACSGVNGALGFLLVGSAVLGVVRGGLLRKAFWLANGLVLVVGLNVVRILLIFGAGNLWGKEVAIDALHPVVGLFTFNLGVAASVLALPLFGIELVPGGTGDDGPASMARSMMRAPRRLPVQRAAIALCIVVAASALAGTADANLRAFQPVAEDLGQPRLSEWSAAAAPVDGWTASLSNSYPWVEQYFGRGATWNRYAYLSGPVASPNANAAGAPPGFVNVDVIATSDLGTFSTYGLEACYGFHNYQVLGTGSIDLGLGVVGHAITYAIPSNRTSWMALYWEWPVHSGARERYERVILNVPNAADRVPQALPSAGDPFAGLQLALAALLSGTSGSSATDPDQAAVEDFLVSFARMLVLARADHATLQDSGS